MKKYTGYDLVLGGLLMALALVFPVIFHAVGLGSSFLPMFYPIVTAGFLVAFPPALTVGLLSPLVSALITGMPPFFPPIVFIMMIEGIALVSVPALFYRKWKTNPWLTAILTMLADRIVLFLTVSIISQWMDLPQRLLGITALVKGLPGVIAIIIIIPPFIKKMEKHFQILPPYFLERK